MNMNNSQEAQELRYQMGYEDGLAGETLTVSEGDWTKPEYHLDYRAGYEAGRAKLKSAVLLLNYRGELRAMIGKLR